MEPAANRHITIRDVLQDPRRWPWTFTLYLPAGAPWTLDTDCLVLDPDDVDTNADDLPAAASLSGLTNAIGIQEVSGVVKNARAQVRSPSPEQLLDALDYYFAHDAYITL